MNLQGHEGKRWYKERIKISIIQIKCDGSFGEQKCMTVHDCNVGSVFDIAFFDLKQAEILGSKAPLPHWKRFKDLEYV